MTHSQMTSDLADCYDRLRQIGVLTHLKPMKNPEKFAFGFQKSTNPTVFLRNPYFSHGFLFFMSSLSRGIFLQRRGHRVDQRLVLAQESADAGFQAGSPGNPVAGPKRFSVFCFGFFNGLGRFCKAKKHNGFSKAKILSLKK